MAHTPENAEEFISFGNVKSTSTSVGVRLTVNLNIGTAAVMCQAISLQALSANTGSVFICNRETPTLADGIQLGILWEILPPNSSPATRPLMGVGHPAFPAPLNATELWVLPAVANEGIRGAALR